MRTPIELLSRSPLWAISDGAADLVVMQLLNADTDVHSWEAAAPYVKGNGPSKTAFVPIQGVLTKDGPSWLGSNYDAISKAVEDAASNPEVKQIVLAVDSPGGQVTGCPETAAVIARAAKVKPVSAIVEGQAASAAYWLASQANDIAVTPSGEVGSVGIKVLHADISKKLDNEGIKITELSAGTAKTAWSPYKPLAPEAQATMQTRIDAAHTDFLNDVASARGERASADMRDKRFGEGQTFSANDAKAHGLVDSVMSTRDFFKGLQTASAENKGLLHARHELTVAYAEIIDF